MKKLNCIRLGHNKNTENCPIVRLGIPESVRIPMSMNMGAACEPIVNVGDFVCVGQKIGDNQAFFSVPVHSGVSGTVTAISDYQLPSGNMCKAIEIQCDGKQTLCESVKSPVISDKASFIKAVRESGMVGLGGAGFPTHVKLSTDAKIDTLIIKKDLPKTALEKVMKVYTLAQKQNNYSQQIKSLIYKLALEEKVSTNKPNNNITVLKTEIEKTNNKTVQSILHSLLAQQYNQYFKQNSWRIYNRSNTNNYKKNDIETWNTNDFNTAINYHFKKSIENIEVFQVASHDTASAIVAVPSKGEDWAYLSSGTWSLLGVELDQPLINEDSYLNNYTNEGGAFNKIRFLKNVSGLWLLQESKRIWEESGFKYTYDELISNASKAKPFSGFINTDADIFLKPDNMPQAINEFLERTGQNKISDHFLMVRVILEGLAFKYREVIEVLDKILNKKLKILHIIGGGSKNMLLNQMTADSTGLQVIAGPSEATALGNILLQAKANGLISGLEEAREIVRNSFELKSFVPQDKNIWDSAYIEYKKIKEKAGDLWKN